MLNNQRFVVEDPGALVAAVAAVAAFRAVRRRRRSPSPSPSPSPPPRRRKHRRKRRKLPATVIVVSSDDDADAGDDDAHDANAGDDDARDAHAGDAGDDDAHVAVTLREREACNSSAELAARGCLGTIEQADSEKELNALVAKGWTHLGEGQMMWPHFRPPGFPPMMPKAT